MTEVEKKLKDTSVQLKLAIENMENPEIFRSCINAFIANARSVTMVMQKEGDGEWFSDWYSKKQIDMRADPLMRFINDQRVKTIHHRSVETPQRKIPIETINGERVEKSVHVMVYEFEDFNEYIEGDNGNVGRICNMAYTYLKDLTHEWLFYSGRL